MTLPAQALVSIRPVPFPYRATLTIANDIDSMAPGAFRAIHNLFTGNRPGELDLEIGNSFWMYDVGTREKAHAYFKALGPEESPEAPMIRDLAAAGFLDALHSFGNFLGVGDFHRGLAERALERLDRDGIKIKVWSNHGGAPKGQRRLTARGTLHHSIGRVYNSLGDLPGSVGYHADILMRYGIRYMWDGLCWEIMGQERRAGLWEAFVSSRGSVRPQSVIRRAVKGALAFGKTSALFPSWIGTSLPYHHTFSGDNHLLKVATLRDGQTLYEFRRYGAFSRDRPIDLPNLINPSRLDYLCRVGGQMLVYNHLGKGATAEMPLPEAALQVMRNLARHYSEGRILVATLSRLLAFNRIVRTLNWRYQESPEGINIEIEGLLDPVFGREDVTADELQGLAFRIGKDRPARCYLRGEILEMKRAPDSVHPGTDVLYLPWKRLPSVRV